METLNIVLRSVYLGAVIVMLIVGFTYVAYRESRTPQPTYHQPPPPSIATTWRT